MMTCSGGEALKHIIVFLFCLSVYPSVLRRSVGLSVSLYIALSFSLSLYFIFMVISFLGWLTMGSKYQGIKHLYPDTR